MLLHALRSEIDQPFGILEIDAAVGQLYGRRQVLRIRTAPVADHTADEGAHLVVRHAGIAARVKKQRLIRALNERGIVVTGTRQVLAQEMLFPLPNFRIRIAVPFVGFPVDLFIREHLRSGGPGLPVDNQFLQLAGFVDAIR